MRISAQTPAIGGSRNWCSLSPQGLFRLPGLTAKINKRFASNPELLAGQQLLLLRNITDTTAGLYSIRATSIFGHVNSNAARISLGNAPVITVHPNNLTAIADSNSSLQVVATGSDLSYQWFKGDQALPNANSATLSFNQINKLDEGSYYCIVTNPLGMAISRNASVFVSVPPRIVIQPSPTTSTGSNGAFFYTKANGDGALIYQWMHGSDNLGNGITFLNYLSQYDSANRKWLLDSTGKWAFINPQGKLYRHKQTYELGTNFWDNPNQLVGLNIILLDNPETYNTNLPFFCRVSNGLVTIETDRVSLTHVPPPTITKHPQSQIIDANQTVTLSIEANGQNLNYQWKADGANIVGANQPTLTLTNVTEADSGIYVCEVFNAVATLQSLPAVIRVRIPATFTIQPQDVTATRGLQAVFRVKATSPTPIQYFWQKDGTQYTGGQTFTIVNYFDTFNSASRKWFRDDRGVWGFLDPQGIYNRSGQKIDLGESAWNQPQDLLSSHFLIFSPAINNHAGTYQAIADNGDGRIFSQSANLTIIAPSPPSVVTHPADTNAMIDGNATLSVEATGTAPLDYQWFKDGTVITNATSSSLPLTQLQTADNGQYFVQISNPFGQATSHNATLRVLPPLKFGLMAHYPFNGNANDESGRNNHGTVDDATLTNDRYNSPNRSYNFDGAGDKITFNDQALPSGSTNRTLSVWFKADSLNGHSDKTIIRYGNQGHGGQSLGLVLRNGKLMPTTWGASNEYLATSVSFDLGAWHHVTWSLESGTAKTYINGTLKDSRAFNVNTVLGSGYIGYNPNPAGEDWDGSIDDIRIYNRALNAEEIHELYEQERPPVILQHPIAQTVNEDQSVTFTVDANGTGITYQWQKDGVNLPNQKSPTLTLTSVDGTDAGQYRVLVGNQHGSIQANQPSLPSSPARSSLSIRHPTQH